MAAATPPPAHPFTWQELAKVVVYAALAFLAARYGLPAPVVHVHPADGQPAPVVTVRPG